MNEIKLPTPYQEFIHLSRYSRWLEEEKRRETWAETVARYFNFFQNHLKEKHGYKLPSELRKELETAVLNLEIMPSMRALMTAGEALARDNTAGYNCSYVAVNKVRAFDEILYILMCGTGVGFSVERQYVEKLPTISEHFTQSDTVIVVKDSKEGWAKATENWCPFLLVDKSRNGIYQRFVLLVRDSRLSEDAQVAQDLWMNCSTSQSTLLRKLRDENLLPSNVMISSAKLQKLSLSAGCVDQHLSRCRTSRTNGCVTLKLVNGGLIIHRELSQTTR
jgi:hypothetical protein